MNIRKSYTLIFAAVLLADIVVVSPVQASEEETVQVPATADAIWESVDQHATVMTKLIQAGTLKEVHHHAFAIRDLTAALPARVKTHSPDQRNQIETQVKFVAALAQRLDASGDSNDRAGAEANLTKLNGVLKSLRALSVTPASK